MDAKLLEKVAHKINELEALTGWVVTLYTDETDQNKLIGVLLGTKEVLAALNVEPDGVPTEEELLEYLRPAKDKKTFH